MKIAIVTEVDNWGNYGSILQLYGLKYYLENLGYEVYHVVPPYRMQKKHFALRKYIENYIILKDMNHKILRYIWRIYRIMEQFFLIYKSHYKYLKECSDIKFITIEKAKKCDCIIFGSDEIWNTEIEYVGKPYYFGSYFENNYKISYAPSAGNLNLNILMEKKYPIELINKINEISVRDENTKKIIEKITKKQVSIVCDPTFLCNLNLLQKKHVSIGEKYFLVYAWEVSEEIKKYIVQFAREEKLQIVCAMGLRKYDFADINIDVPALAFGNIVKNAAYVFTSTYHGCAFSILNHKQAIYEMPNQKTRDILYQYNLQSRVFTPEMLYSEFEKILKSKINEKELETCIQFNRSQSEDFLNAAITKALHNKTDIC